MTDRDSTAYATGRAEERLGDLLDSGKYAGGPHSYNPYGESLLQLQVRWWRPTAAIPMENPYCSCNLTRKVSYSCNHYVQSDGGGLQLHPCGESLLQLQANNPVTAELKRWSTLSNPPASHLFRYVQSDGDEAFAFDRTASRLMEMGSKASHRGLQLQSLWILPAAAAS